MRLARFGLLLAAVLIQCLPCSAQCSQQPTGVKVVHEHGQTFVTWDEVPNCPNVLYRVHRSSVPLTSLSVAAAPGHTVPQDSGEFYADRIHSPGQNPCGSYRYVKRLHVPDGLGNVAEVASNHGVLVWTLDSSDFSGGFQGTGFYAVTTLDPNNNYAENTALGPQNTARTTEAVAPPVPIEVTKFVQDNPPTYTDCPGSSEPPHGIHVYIQYMDLHDYNPTFDAPNALNCWWGEDPSLTRIQEAIQYAHTYTVAEPDPDAICSPSAQLPLIVRLHPRTGLRWKQSYCKENFGFADACAFQLVPIDAMDTWWFGFADRTFDYRKVPAGAGGYGCMTGCDSSNTQGGTPPYVPTTPSTIHNYTEARVLRMIDDLMNDPVLGPRVDRNRVYVVGHSMGGSGALSMAMRFPDLFAAADASKPMTDYREYVKQLRGLFPYPTPCPTGHALQADYADDLELRWGAFGTDLPVVIDGPAKWVGHLGQYIGTGVWTWQDHEYQLRMYPEERRVPIGMVNGQLDRTIPYASQGENSYGAFLGSLQCWAGKLSCEDHGNSQFEGQSPGLSAPMATRPFHGYTVVRDESVPGFRDPILPPIPANTCMPCDSPCRPGQCNSVSYRQNIRWASSWLGASPNGVPLQPPSETPANWTIDLFTTDGSTVTVDLTPRRLKGPLAGGFDLASATNTWTSEDPVSMVTLQTGPVLHLPNGVVVLQGVTIGPNGIHLVLK